MVEAVDTLCETGWAWAWGWDRDRDRMGGDYIDHLSPSFCFWLGLDLGLWLTLRIVNTYSLQRRNPPREIASFLLHLTGLKDKAMLINNNKTLSLELNLCV